MKSTIFILSLCLVFICACKNTKTIQETPITTSANDYSKTLETIAIGSCNHRKDPQPLWQDILRNNPELWIWLGDIIYGDTENEEVLANKYAEQKVQQEYVAFLENPCDVIGIWDDHDYGVNNGGKEYPMKAVSRDLLFNFLDVPQNDPARSREGAYNSFTYGSGNQKVKIILLDARYFRDKENVDNGTILGKTQWQWLEKELSDSDAALHLIASGIQIIPKDHRFEKWANYPNERKRLFDLVAQHLNTGVVFLSGDRHIAEISQLAYEGMDKDFIEITSSGLTHYYNSFSSEVNQHRIGEVVADYNFGLLNIDWDAKRVAVEIRSSNNEVRESAVVEF